MKKGFKFFFLFGLILLPGCLLGPNFQQPVMDMPQDFRSETLEEDARVDLKWWELFDDPTLRELVSIALEENKSMLIAASRIEEARAVMGFAKSDLYPRIDLEALIERGNLAGTAKSDSVNNTFYIAPVLNWEIDFWGKYRRASESAVAQLLASQYSLRTVQIGIISEVVSTYFFFLDYHQGLDLSRRTLE